MSSIILRFPRAIAAGIVLICALLGILLQTMLGLNFFERMGALCVGLCVFVFGLVVAELINRGQEVDFDRFPHVGQNLTDQERGALGGLYSRNNVSLVLNSQAIALLVGTIQASFGSLILGAR